MPKIFVLIADFEAYLQMHDFSVISLKLVEKRFLFRNARRRVDELPPLIFPEGHPQNLFQIFFPEQSSVFKCIFRADFLAGAKLARSAHYANKEGVLKVLEQVR